MSDDENEDTTYQVVFDDEPDKKYPYLPLRDGKAKGICVAHAETATYS